MNDNTKKPVLIVVAGPNGSGKTTITKKLLHHQWIEGNNCVYINPDIIAQEVFGDWNSRDAIISAANYAQEKREACLAEKRSLAFETVFSSPEKIAFIQQAISDGFFVRFFFICTNDPTICAQRVAQRVLGKEGHDVPIPKIISRYYKSLVNCKEILPHLDRAYFYDNSDENHNPRLLFRVSQGKVIKTYGKLTPWVEEIFASLNAPKPV